MREAIGKYFLPPFASSFLDILIATTNDDEIPESIYTLR